MNVVRRRRPCGSRTLAATPGEYQAGDSNEELACLTRAVALWRGDPLVDLAAIAELDGEVEFVRRRLVDGCLRLGELLLVHGRFDEWPLRAISSNSTVPDSSLRSTLLMLDDLGVEPDDATGVNAHHDTGFLTLLWQHGVRGLQVLNDDNEWIDVEPMPGAIVVNRAELLAGEHGIGSTRSETYGEQLWNYFTRSYPDLVERHHADLVASSR